MISCQGWWGACGVARTLGTEVLASKAVVSFEIETGRLFIFGTSVEPTFLPVLP